MGLVSLCLESILFKFRDKMYHQKMGTPMDSPISVVLTEMAMQRYKKEVLEDAPTSLKIWERYVDDVFVIVKKGEVEPFFDLLNGKNEAIQSEMNKEKNGRLLFLDVMVKRNDDTLTTGIYGKDTDTDRLLDYNSCHPVEHKRSVVKTLWSWAEKVYSTDASINVQCYKYIITRWTSQQPNVEVGDSRRDAPQVTVNYLRGASEVVARLPRKHGVEVTHKPRNTLHRALTKVKDTESLADRIGVVYDVKYKVCETHSFGETEKKLATRL
ncbi:uncharacterized protein LOC143028727 [Oratosquilla oratoria]|uniref:uncharacterized protein LOC143028727 n=1 Tax=Oratosquilla oratoria TaxID=337810 RepID=UPI003F767192